MDEKTIKNKLKKCQPYFVEKDLFPKLYFNEERLEQERWIFKYSFIRKLSDVSIGIRLGYTSQNIHYITKCILYANKNIIEEFLITQGF